MKHKKIFSFFTGLILGNIYFAIEDNNKLNKLKIPQINSKVFKIIILKIIKLGFLMIY